MNVEKRAAEQFDELVAVFAKEPGVTPPEPAAGRRAFGANALKANGKIFAMLVNDRIVLKLPRPRVSELIEAGRGEPFDAGKGRPMKEWVSLTTTVEDQSALGHEALDFVRSRA